jgi:hypothetical protein
MAATAKDDTCQVCGFPEWWVDNDCEACGCVPHLGRTESWRII